MKKNNNNKNNMKTIKIDEITYMKLYIYAENKSENFSKAIEELLKK